MKILHTSDWHIGRTLCNRTRYDEFELFFSWLDGCIRREAIDVLLVAGDIFDTTTPSNRAQHIYYNFLEGLRDSCCRHVVIIGGNHDSPTLLQAPSLLLRHLQVHVVGGASSELELADEVISLRNEQDDVELYVCAVPYLRDRDLRTSEAGESTDDKAAKLIAGMQAHYQAVADIAVEKRTADTGKSTGEDTGESTAAIIAMGHLFTAGGQTREGDGVKELYVGSLAHISATMFPDVCAYVALGHLHIPQKVGGLEHIRYCGSPLPMGFNEANQQKKVVICEATGTGTIENIQEHEIPCFQHIESITGTVDTIRQRLDALNAEQSTAWVEIEYTGQDIIGSLSALLEKQLENSALTVLRMKNKRLAERALQQQVPAESLEDMSETNVFERCLAKNDVPDEQRQELLTSYQEILKTVQEADTRAE